MIATVAMIIITATANLTPTAMAGVSPTTVAMPVITTQTYERKDCDELVVEAHNKGIDEGIKLQWCFVQCKCWKEIRIGL